MSGPSCERCWDIRRVLVPATAEGLCAVCAWESETDAEREMREVAYQMRAAERKQELAIERERLQMAMRSRSCRRLVVPEGGLFEMQGGLFQ